MAQPLKEKEQGGLRILPDSQSERLHVFEAIKQLLWHCKKLEDDDAIDDMKNATRLKQIKYDEMVKDFMVKLPPDGQLDDLALFVTRKLMSARKWREMYPIVIDPNHNIKKKAYTLWQTVVILAFGINWIACIGDYMLLGHKFRGQFPYLFDSERHTGDRGRTSTLAD